MAHGHALLPLVEQDLGGSAGTRIRWAQRFERAWPRVDESQAARWGLGLLAALALWGCLRLTPDDDLKLLYARDAALESEQEHGTELAGLPRSSGYFVLRAADEQALLEKEEALLAALEAAGIPSAAWQATAHWSPSLKQQAQVQKLWQGALSGAKARALEDALGAEGWSRDLRRSLALAGPALLPALWLAQPASTPYRFQWLGLQGGERASMILPSVQVPATAVAKAAQAAASIAGVRWVDKAAETKAALGQLRAYLTWVLWVGFALVLGLLVYSFKGRAWRAALPTALGLLAGLGSLGLLGLPLNLFGLLALILVLGLGVDYGIYIQDAEQQPLSAFVAVNLAAMTNIAAFGLLAFSGTPALKAFGLVLAVGTGVAWLSSPCFAPSTRSDHA